MDPKVNCWLLKRMQTPTLLLLQQLKSALYPHHHDKPINQKAYQNDGSFATYLLTASSL